MCITILELTVIVALGHVAGAPEVGLVVGVLQNPAVAVHLGGAPLTTVGRVGVSAAVVLLYVSFIVLVGEGELALHLLIFAFCTI